MYTIFVISAVLAGLSLALMFFPRVPAVIAAYAAMTLPSAAGVPLASGSELLFWGSATLIVLGLRIMQQAPSMSAVLQAYSCGGALAGGAVAMVSSFPPVAGAAGGAFLGILAWNRTPAGARLPVGSRAFVDFLASAGLPAVVCVAISLRVLAGVRAAAI